MRKVALLFLFLMLGSGLLSQELDCTVTVSSQRLEGTDKRIFESLQNAMFEFMNNRKWTNYNIKVEERIECTILLDVTERIGGDEFRGNLNIVVRRPVFNTAYNSVLLNYLEKGLQFKYTEFQPLDYSEGTYISNLTSTLAFYSYIFLGLYFDSFSMNGGSQFYEKAQEIVNTAQNASEPGWKAYENDKNRFWLAENYMNPANAPIREFLYKYHISGLDLMYDKVDLGRGGVAESLRSLQKIYNAKPGLYALQLILEAKRDEFVNIFADSRVPPMERTSVVNLLKEIDPANTSKYQAILNAN